MRVPRSHRGRERVLSPATEWLPGQRHHARRRQPRRAVEVASEFRERRRQFREEVQVARAFIEIPGGVVANVRHLRVEVVVIIAFPRRQAAVVRRPNTLQRHRRRAPPRGCAVEVAAEHGVILDGRLGHLKARLPPEVPPPRDVWLQHRRVPLGHGRGATPTGQSQRVRIVVAGSDRDRDEGFISGVARFETNAVPQAVRRVLHKPLRSPRLTVLGGRIAQPCHCAAAAGTSGAAVLVRAGGNQQKLFRLRSGDAEQRHW